MSLGMVGLIDDVAPGGGAFTVWPRSHRRLFHTFEQQYSGGSITHNDSREEAEKAEYLLREKHMYHPNPSICQTKLQIYNHNHDTCPCI